MVKFRKNDKVIALNSNTDINSQTRTKGKIYSVKEFTYCNHCGSQRINLGGMYINGNVDIGCGDCEKSQSNDFLDWTASKYFVLADDIGIKEALIKAIYDEDYEVAILLRDFNKKINK